MNEGTIKRIEDMVLDYGTTYRNSYKFQYDFQCFKKKAQSQKIVPQIPQTKPKEEKKAPIFKHCETMTPTEKLPFNLFWKPKEILRTTPYDEQKRPPEISNEERNRIQRSRPRVVMFPQISLNDIPDPRTRDTIINDMYTTTWARDVKSLERDRNIAPLPKFPAPAKPCFLPPFQPPKIQSEWLMDSVTWEKRQLRSYVQPDKEFWQRRTLSASKLQS